MNDESGQKVLLPKDIIVAAWDPALWKSMPPDEAIHSLFCYADTEARKAVAWYEAAKHRKATASRTLRWLAIAFFVVGGLAPIVAGFLHGSETANKMLVITQSGYLMLGLAAGFVAFDRYFGMSSGWIRYMTSLAAIERLRAEFVFDWAVLLQKTPMAIDDATKLLFLERAKTFQSGVLELVDKETAAWIAEFQTSIADLEKVVQAQRQAAEANLQTALKQEREMRARLKTEEERAATERRPGAINIEIGGDPEGPTEILLDGARVKETTARTAALINVSTGQHAIEVRSVKGGQPISASKVLVIEPGAIAEVKLIPS